MRKWTVLVGFACALVSAPSRATDFTGADVASGVRRSIDIVHDHLQLEQAQRRYERILWYFGYTHRWSPGKLVFDDGKRVSANLNRVQLNLGGGFGSYEDYGVIFGAQLDFVQFLGNLGERGRGVRAAPGQSHLFLGAVGHGFQLTVGQMQNQMSARGFPLDPYGNFSSTEGTPHRTGTPHYIAFPDANDGTAFIHTLFTGYHESGAFFAVTYANASGSMKGHVSEARFNFQPLKRYLPDLAGLPTFGIAKLDALKSYYGEALNSQGGKQLDAQAPGGPPSGIPPRNTKDPYEVEVGTDDALGIGARVRLVGTVQPNVAFKRADFGIVHFEEIGSRFELVAAARAIAFRHDGTNDAAVDSFALIGIPPFRKSPDHIGFPFHAGISYSYNSPDGSTFLPIPKAHVFGVQLVVGVPETSKPLIPIVRTVREKKKLGFFGEEEAR
jgi:hypothetical protein